MKKLKILLADDHTLIRIGLSALIGSEDDMTVVGEADNGEEAVRLALKLKPDVVIMDLLMPKMSGAEATKALHEADPSIRILILTSYGSSSDMATAVANGADGAILKDAASDSLVSAIRAVARGRQAFPKKILSFVEESAAMIKLTDRQLDILGSVTRGLTNQEIAQMLDITENGVKKQIRAIFDKLGASNRSEAVSIALSKHLLKA